MKYTRAHLVGPRFFNIALSLLPAICVACSGSSGSGDGNGQNPEEPPRPPAVVTPLPEENSPGLPPGQPSGQPSVPAETPEERAARDSAAVMAAIETLGATSWLGSNLSADAIVNNLSLPGVLPDDVSIRWESDHAERLDPVSGRVRRLLGVGPSDVTLRVTVSRGQATESKEFPLKVVPYTLGELSFMSLPQGLAGFAGLASSTVVSLGFQGESLFAATSGGLSFSADAGQTWSTRTVVGGVALNEITQLFAAGQTLYAGTKSQGLLVSDNNGQSWSTRTEAQGLGGHNILQISQGEAGLFVLTATEDVCMVFRSTDGAQSFQRIDTLDGLSPAFPRCAVRALHVDGKKLFIGGKNLLISENGGESFKVIEIDTESPIEHISSAQNRVYLSTYFDGIFVSESEGNRFVKRTTENTNGQLAGNYSTAKPYAKGSQLFVPNDGVLSVSQDGGRTFSKRTFTSRILSITGTGNMVVVGMDNGLAVSRDGGATFTSQTASTELGGREPAFGMRVLGSQLFYLTRKGVEVFDETTQTVQKKDVGSGLGCNIMQKLVVQVDKILLTGLKPECGLGRSLDKGATFSTQAMNSVLNDVFADESRVYAAAPGTGLLVSMDNGVTFDKRNNLNSNLGSDKVSRVVAAGSDIAAVYLEESFFHGVSISRDGGAKFTLNKTAENGLTGQFVSDLMFAAESLFVATEAGVSVFDKGDGYAAGRTLELPLKGAKLQREGSTIYVLGKEGGGIAISNDGGKSFDVRTPENSGLASDAIHDIALKEGVLYVATEGGLSVSLDGGKSFVNKSLIDGVSNLIVTDVEVEGAHIYLGTSLGLVKSVWKPL